ncbi:hypothetical protein MTO96_047926 [Rhipicephalus appendiculatus]
MNADRCSMVGSSYTTGGVPLEALAMRLPRSISPEKPGASEPAAEGNDTEPHTDAKNAAAGIGSRRLPRPQRTEILFRRTSWLTTHLTKTITKDCLLLEASLSEPFSEKLYSGMVPRRRLLTCTEGSVRYGGRTHGRVRQQTPCALVPRAGRHVNEEA